jgi:phage regulator Rha-like protein
MNNFEIKVPVTINVENIAEAFGHNHEKIIEYILKIDSEMATAEFSEELVYNLIEQLIVEYYDEEKASLMQRINEIIEG